MSTDSQSTPVVETQPNEQQPDLTMRALEERIRQQEILAELGVAALQGASLEQLLTDTARLTARGLAGRILQGARAHPRREPPTRPRGRRLGSRHRRHGERWRRSGIAGGVRVANGQARHLEPPGERGAVSHARACCVAWRAPGDERHPARRRQAVRRTGGRQPVRRRVRRARSRIPARCRQHPGHGDRARTLRTQPQGGARRATRCCSGR